MTSVTDAPENPLPFRRSRSRGRRSGHVIGWLRANLFSSIPSTVISLLLILLLAKACVSLVQWGFWNAIWSLPGNDTNACRAIRGLGACWAVIPEKFRFILFGTYPFDQQWRPALATLVFIALFFLSSRRSFWRKELVLVWAAALVVIGLLMWGGIPGLPFVSQDRWGGLPVTLILATFGLAFGFPLGILVALGRRSKLPAIRSLCVLYVELIRGVPLISLLFMASVMFPLFMPDGVNIDKLLRAQIAFVLYAGAYLAEVIRGGLQAVPRGQHEAAGGLGLSYWQKRLDHSAAGNPPCDPTPGEYVHRVLQGYQSGSDHRHLRPADDGQDRHHRSRLAVVQCRGLRIRGADLFRLLLCHVTLQPTS
jgi:general L-amino acid transport system permease protein